LKICREAAVDLVIPTIDTELKVLSENRDRFLEIGTRVMISSPETIEITHDKWSTHRWLKREGFPTVLQATPEAVLANPDDWDFPLLIKPVSGSASVGVEVVSSPAELSAGTARGDYIVQTLAQGEEYTVSVFISGSGECIDAVPRKRLEVRAGEVSKGITVRLGPVEALAESVIGRLPGAYGALNIQIFWDEMTQQLKIIEINPRFGGGYPLAWEAGAPYSAWLIQDVLGMPLMKVPPWRDGVVMLRYDEAIFVTSTDIEDSSEPGA
jgi:carbamoyl-phosphate synthase large subunit